MHELQSGAFGKRALAFALVVFVVFSSFAPLAVLAEEGAPAEAEPTVIDALPLQEEPADEPAEELPPTEIPTDVPLPPTEEPVPPTEEPLPTDVPAPPVEIPPTEIVIPAEEPTSTTAPTQAPTATPSPTPSPTPAGTPKPSRVGPLSVGPGGDYLSNCRITGGSDVMQPGEVVTATCTYIRVSDTYYAEFELKGAPAGWGMRVNARNGDSGMTTGGSAFIHIWLGIIPPRSFPVEFSLQAPANAVAGTQAVAKLDAKGCFLGSCGSAGVADTTTLDAKIAPLGADDMSMACSPANPLSVPRVGKGSFSCTINALNGLNKSSLLVRSVTVPAAPAGWTMTTSPAGTAGTGGAVTIPVNKTLAAGTSYTFTITLSPGCSAASSANWNITSQVANTNGTTTSGNVAGPSRAYSANTTTAQTVSANVVSSNLNWAFTSGFESQTANGQITYQVTGSGCSGWNVTTSASPFTYTGSAPGTSIPANNLTLTSTDAPTAVIGNLGSVTAPAASGGLGTSRKVLQAQPGSGNGTYQQSLDIGFTLPENTNVGTYTSTITVTAAAAP